MTPKQKFEKLESIIKDNSTIGYTLIMNWIFENNLQQSLLDYKKNDDIINEKLMEIVKYKSL